jgi:hypothetical protein
MIAFPIDMTGISALPQGSRLAYHADQGLGRDAPLGYHGDGPAHGIAGLMLSYRTNHPRHRSSIQHHSRRQTPILGEATTSGLYRIGNFDRFHASPAVTVAKQLRDDLHDIEQPLTMIPIRRFDSESIITTHSDHPARRRTFSIQSHRGNRHTVASWKSPVTGSPVRLNATAPV